MTVDSGDLQRIAILETKLDSQSDKLDDLAAKIDAFLKKADDKYATKEQAEDQENRIRTLEKAYYAALAFFALLQIIANYYF